MRRRSFLGGAAVAAAWPRWLRRGFADASVAPPRSARAGDKPLLVLVVPDDEDERWLRGRLFAEMIDRGDDAHRAPLALCEVACERLGATRIRVDPTGAPPMLLLRDRGRTDGITAWHFVDLTPRVDTGYGPGTAYDLLAQLRARLFDRPVLRRLAARGRETL